MPRRTFMEGQKKIKDNKINTVKKQNRLNNIAKI
jgi:hypothetical protein